MYVDIDINYNDDCGIVPDINIERSDIHNLSDDLFDNMLKDSIYYFIVKDLFVILFVDDNIKVFFLDYDLVNISDYVI